VAGSNHAFSCEQEKKTRTHERALHQGDRPGYPGRPVCGQWLESDEHGRDLHGQRQQKAHKTEKKTLSAEEQDAGKGRCRQKRACRVQTEEEKKKMTFRDHYNKGFPR